MDGEGRDEGVGTGVSKARQPVSARSMTATRCATPAASSLAFARESIVSEPSRAWISAPGKRRASASAEKALATADFDDDGRRPAGAG